MCGFQAAGAAPSWRADKSPTRRRSPRRFALAIPPVAGRTTALAESHGVIESVTDAEILAAYALAARLEGLFAEPASAARWPACSGWGGGAYPKGSLVTLTLTATG